MDASKAITGNEGHPPVNDQTADAGRKGFGEERDSGEANRDSKDRDIFKDGSVLYLGEDRNLQLTSQGLKLARSSKATGQDSKSKIEDLEISWQHVILAEMGPSQAQDQVRRSFRLHYIDMCERKLRAQCINLTSVNEPADEWVDIIKDNCKKVTGRPKKMLVLVNTVGGMGNGSEIYQKKVAPIFQLAQIITNVIYTERPKHSRDIAETEDLSSFDCVVVVGGDGTYQEVLHGMTVQMQKSAGVDYNDVNSNFASLNKPIGIIPAGSWNCLSASLNNDVTDVETAALRILTGEIHRSQIFKLHSNGKFFTVAGLSVLFGDLTRISKRNVELRWMKKYRYYYTTLTYLFKKKGKMDLSLEYLLAPQHENNSSHGSRDGGQEERNEELEWIRHDDQGKMYQNLFITIPNLTDEEGRSMKNPFTDHANIYIDMGCATLRILKLRRNVIHGKNLNEHYDNVDITENVRGLRIKVLRGEEEDEDERSKKSSHSAFEARLLEYLVSLDGDCFQLDAPEVEVRVIPSFVPLFATKVL